MWMKICLKSILLCGTFMIVIKNKGLTEAREIVRFGVILPETHFSSMVRAYIQKINDGLKYTRDKHAKLRHLKNYYLGNPKVVDIPILPKPIEILNALCDKILVEKIAALLYFSNTNLFVKNSASAQYLLHLTTHLGIPVVAWNADNSGLDLRISNQMVIQLAPTLHHQVAAMMSILERYTWSQFSILTSKVNGHQVFIQSVRDQAAQRKFEILDVVSLQCSSKEQILPAMQEMAMSETRVILLYATREEAGMIFSVAKELDLTSKDYAWIASQSVAGSQGSRAYNSDFPRGMLGVTFDTRKEAFTQAIYFAVIAFGQALQLLVKDQQEFNITASPNQSCWSQSYSPWKYGKMFYKYLKKVKIDPKNYPKGRGFMKRKDLPSLEFNDDGSIKNAKIEIVNLNKKGIWDQIGSWTRKGLEINDIFWPGDSALPPVGKPEKFKLKVSFLEEPPYLMSSPPDNTTGLCQSTRAVKCYVSSSSSNSSSNETSDYDQYKCCSGLTIDLLEMFAADLGFEYDMERVEDGLWGTEKNGTWNGLIADLINHKADLVVTSIKINSEREKVVDFTIPFLDTGISSVVAKRTGIISPKAFLEPFDTVSWLLILLVSIQVAAFFIFAFEWLSPDGYNMKVAPPRDHKFSLFRTYWLVWALLFGAAVNMDCPRGYSARFMASVWAMFAVVFLAIYTANLAAFMITREEYYDLSGIDDTRFLNPRNHEPPFKYSTVPNGNTWAVLKQNFPQMYNYMRRMNRTSVSAGIEAVKHGKLHAFIYDSTVLDYLVSQDNECKLLSVGAWYAMTGYGFALPKGSVYLDMFSKQMMKYRELGDIERLQRFWLTGACKPKKNRQNSSKPLSIDQFMSAFFLLGCGIILTIFLLILEHIYFQYFRKHLAKKDTGGCFSLVSLSMGKSLSFRGAVYEAQDWIKRHRCRDPLCDTQLWKVRHELDMAKIKIAELEAHIDGRPLPPISEILRPRDRTRPFVATNELTYNALPAIGGVGERFHDGHYYRPVSTEIAEKETVL